MPTIFHPQTADGILERMDRLTPSSPALWGSMNAGQMVCHLTDACKIALGDTPTTLRSRILSRKLVRWLFISVLPVPRGKVRTTREFQMTSPQAWATDLETLKQYFGRVQSRGRMADATWNVHPAFGHLSTSEYGKLFYKHVDHHLRQFGV